MTDPIEKRLTDHYYGACYACSELRREAVSEIGALRERNRALEAELRGIALVCAQAPPCDELDEDIYNSILDGIQNRTRAGLLTPETTVSPK